MKFCYFIITWGMEWRNWQMVYVSGMEPWEIKFFSVHYDLGINNNCNKNQTQQQLQQLSFVNLWYLFKYANNNFNITYTSKIKSNSFSVLSSSKGSTTKVATTLTATSTTVKTLTTTSAVFAKWTVRGPYLFHKNP